jgi:CDP-diacylglycerol---serine O-phosphatidyltransferase
MSYGPLRIIRMSMPSMLTSFNMGFGFLSICCSLGILESYISEQHTMVAASWFIVLAALLDSLDGKVARILGASSKFGIQLDSLADVISFGVAPAVLLMSSRGIFLWPLFLTSFIFLVAGAGRLARFNVQTKSFEKKNFAGLPIPMGAMAVVSYVIFSDHVWGGLKFFNSFLLMSVLVALLMVSTIEYDSFPKFTLRTLKSKILLCVLALGVVLLVRYPAILFFVFT